MGQPDAFPHLVGLDETAKQWEKHGWLRGFGVFSKVLHHRDISLLKGPKTWQFKTKPDCIWEANQGAGSNFKPVPFCCPWPEIPEPHSLFLWTPSTPGCRPAPGTPSWSSPFHVLESGCFAEHRPETLAEKRAEVSIWTVQTTQCISGGFLLVTNTESCLVHKVQVRVEVCQVGVFLLDDVGDEVKQRLGAVSRLGVQKLKVMESQWISSVWVDQKIKIWCSKVWFYTQFQVNDFQWPSLVSSHRQPTPNILFISSWNNALFNLPRVWKKCGTNKWRGVGH